MGPLLSYYVLLLKGCEFAALQALADSGASGEEIAKTLKETFAKAMKEDPSAAADLARTMAVALAAAGASAEDIAETMKEALSAGLNLGDGASPDDILDVVETVARKVHNSYPISPCTYRHPSYILKTSVKQLASLQDWHKLKSYREICPVK